MRANTFNLAHQIMPLKSSEYEGFDDDYSTHHMAIFRAWRNARRKIHTFELKGEAAVKTLVDATIHAVHPVDLAGEPKVYNGHELVDGHE